MVIVDENGLTRRLNDLVEQLEAEGSLRSPEWREAFLSVRRHVFVPRFWHDEEPGAYPARWRMIDNATSDHDQWLDAVYSDRTLATELTGVPTRDGTGMHPQVTSSTTMPSLVMAMLEDLDVRAGMRVLEIGTGTGYNAALLCARLGEEHVASIDVGPELVALAGVRLAEHGYRPHLVAGDGAAGVPDRAPFDRIVATCGLAEIPSAWIEQTREGGKILLNLLGPFNAFAMVLLTVTAGAASGRYLRQSGGFMPRRADPVRAHDYTVAIRRPAAATESRSTLDPKDLYTDSTWGLLAQSVLSGVVGRQVYIDDEEHLGTELATADGSSWAEVQHDGDSSGHRVMQAGPRQLWAELELFHQHWTDQGQPAYHRFGLTIGGGRPSMMWLDDPADAATAASRR